MNAPGDRGLPARESAGLSGYRKLRRRVAVLTWESFVLPRRRGSPMAMIQFTRNYTDRSNDQGFQFEFHCDKCGNGHMSAFEGSTLGLASSFLKAAGSFFGGALSRAAYAGDHVKDALRGKAWDDAYGNAVNEAKRHFKHCTRCGHWVCPEACWNEPRGLCEDCAPNLAGGGRPHPVQGGGGADVGQGAQGGPGGGPGHEGAADGWPVRTATPGWRGASSARSAASRSRPRRAAASAARRWRPRPSSARSAEPPEGEGRRAAGQRRRLR